MSRAEKNEIGASHCCGHLGLHPSRPLEEAYSLLLCSSREGRGAVYLLVTLHWAGLPQGVLMPSCIHVANSGEQLWESKIPDAAETGATRWLQPWLAEEELGLEDVRRACRVSSTTAYQTLCYLPLGNLHHHPLLPASTNLLHRIFSVWSRTRVL